MRWRIYVLAMASLGAALMLPCFSHAQTNPSLKQEIATFYFDHEPLNDKNHYVKLDKLIKRLEQKRANQSDDISFLKTIFFKTHKKVLLRYNSLASMNETITSGSYGCLSGTILYALILDHFGYTYEILELPNHVFLRVNVDEQVFYLESTMPNDGFMTAQKFSTLKTEQDTYLSNATLPIVSQEGPINRSNADFKVIGLQELQGLQHFNESVKLYKQAKFDESIVHAMDAYIAYPNPKNQMLMCLIINKAFNDESHTNESKLSLLHTYQAKSPVINKINLTASLPSTLEQ